jgi:hypothetical protein
LAKRRSSERAGSMRVNQKRALRSNLHKQQGGNR